jgi:WD40 repeat protein
MQRCTVKEFDEDATKVTALACSADGRWLATGADKGIVSFHKIQFSTDSKLAVVSSKAQRDSIRLVQLPSIKVFSSWPTSQTPLGYISAASFSPGTRFLAIVNDNGRVLIYSLYRNHLASL